MKLSFQVVSDTHLEHLPFQKTYDWSLYLTIKADILVLAGDIGSPLEDRYWDFIKYCSERCLQVLLLTGNHEYYNSSISIVNKIMTANVKKFNNVRFLQEDFFILGDYVFIGCTLWSHIPQQHEQALSGFLADFKYIQNFTVHDFNELHQKSIKYLEEAINFFSPKFKIILVSHHTPLFNTSHHPKYKDQISQYAFSSDLSKYFPHIKAWIYGHTHYDDPKHLYQIPKYEVKFISNQRGYPTSVRYNYDPNFKVDLLDI